MKYNIRIYALAAALLFGIVASHNRLRRRRRVEQAPLCPERSYGSQLADLHCRAKEDFREKRHPLRKHHHSRRHQYYPRRT